MLETQNKHQDQDKPGSGELRISGDQAHGFYNTIHLIMIPAPHGGTGFHVFFTEDNAGKPDFTRIKNSLAIDGNREDLPEIADMFMRRLTSGVPIENIFLDFQEQNRKMMAEAYEKFRQQ